MNWGYPNFNGELKIFDIGSGEFSKEIPYGYLHLDQKYGQNPQWYRISPYDVIFLSENEIWLLYFNEVIFFCQGDYDWSAYSWDEVWNFKTGKMTRKIPQAPNGNITHIEFSPDSRIVTSASKDSTIMIWNSEDGKFYQKIDDLSQSISISPDLLYLASYGIDNFPRIYEITSGKVYRTLPKQVYGMSYFKYSPEGKKLIIADTNYNITVFDVRSGQISQVYKSHSKRLYSVNFESENSWIGIGGNSEWNIQTDVEICKIKSWGNITSEDGKFKAVIYGDNIQILNIKSDSIIKEINIGQKMNIGKAVFTHDNSHIILSELSDIMFPYYRTVIYSIDLSSGIISEIYSMSRCSLKLFEVSPNDKQIAFTNEKADLIVIDNPFVTDVQTNSVTLSDNNSILYPNPASDFINLRFNLAKSTNISIKIYDILGNSVAEFANEWCNEGWQNKQIDISKLQSGTYYCRLQAGGETKVIKIVKIE